MIFGAAAAVGLTLSAQTPVQVGRGSYASFPPLANGRTDAHGGDLSTFMQTKKLWVTERDGEPIPTNDWWTGLINAPFADALWSYPAMVHPSETGVTVNYPTYWNENGTEVKWRTSMEVRGEGFRAVSAIADSWHDWDVEMLMADASGKSRMKTTLAHGMPFTWIELENIAPRIVMSDDAEFYSAAGRQVTPRMLPYHSDNSIGVKIGDDCYGLFFPKGCRLSLDGRTLAIDGDKVGYMVVALLPTMAHLEEYAEVALNVPRDTRVDWSYDERRGEIASTWRVDAVSLADGSRGDVLQGFLPHAYKGALRMPSFSTDTYLTPRGTMKMASGREFTFAHKFAGMLPWYGTPQVDASKPNPFRPEVMETLMRNYALNGAFGDDTYWGGKGLTQMALNMTFALQLGNRELFEMSRDKLKAKLVDWLTYTPGEKNVFFARYPRWGGLVGQATSYDSDTFNDHHFHYGYFTLAGALLCMVDEDFKNAYGPMLREIAKDYANWQREDKRYPFLRTMDPWVGHSYAGGLGDQGNSNGNGQESTSESMQGWGGVYLLGVALGDKEMRAAGIFGWSTEARATREYWFDVDSRFDKHGEGGNYDYTLYKSPYNSNITCKGIGWWTWFGGDPLFMHGIQWMPISPALDYLSWDRDFVKWAYDDLMASPGWNHSWFEDGIDPGGNKVERLAANDWGNVTLAYMQRALPDEAAAIFDRAYDEGLGIATNISTGHISYYIIHSHRTYGEIDTSVNADIPSANAFVNAAGEYSYTVYNPGEERTVNFYRDGTLIKSVKAPSRKFTTFTEAAAASEIEISSEKGCRFLDASLLSATVLDQYGATVDGAKVAWTVANPAVGSIGSDGTFTVNPAAPLGSSTDVTATCNAAGKTLTATITVSVNAPARLESGAILPATRYVEKGNPVDFTLDAVDQYGEKFDGDVVWTINGVAVGSPRVDGTTVGMYRIAASDGGKTVEHTIYITPALADLAHGRPAVSSSEENAGTLTANVNDGDATTRWGSAHRDGEWIYVDLGKDCILTRVVVNWEAAYASEYLIQLAPDGVSMEKYTGNYFAGTKTVDVPAEASWQTLASVTGISSAGVKTTAVDGTGRYLRIKSLKRGSAYGTSILELNVHGVPADAAATDAIGIDIISPEASVDEDKTLSFSAVAYNLAGEQVSTPVEWSVSSGSITSDGVFTPAGYGEATVTATTPAGFSASRTVMVNEVVRLASLDVTPASLTIVEGDKATFTASGLDQFGGAYPLSESLRAEVLVDGVPSDGVEVNIAESHVKGLRNGSYIVRLTSGDVSVDIPVEVAALSEVNIALGRPATAGSGDNPSAVFDGNAETRWQAAPGQPQWIAVELAGLYAVNRFFLRWEGAFAERYHIEVSSDGVNWATAAANTTAPSQAANLCQTLEIEAVPARYVRVVPDELNDYGRLYGMSLFEVEVYASARLDSDDNEAPVIGNADFSIEGSTLTVNAVASDNSGYVTYSLVATGVSAVDAPEFTASVISRTGIPVTLTLPLSDECSSYRCVLTVSDASGNSASVNRDVTVSGGSLVGVNLALGRPVETSSNENAGLSGANAVDGNTATKWGSKFEDNQWMMVDLEGVYNINRIVITTTDAGAYARKALIEYSVDGNKWETLTTRERDGIGVDEIPVNDVKMRYLRYTGIERSSQYGTTLSELEVYGDRRMLSVLSSDRGTLRLSGAWDDAIFSSLDNEGVTGYDLLGVTAIPASISVANPNCVIYAPVNVDADCNVAVVNGTEAVATTFTMRDSHDFHLAMDVKVTGDVRFIPTDASDAMALTLPFDFVPTGGATAYCFFSLSDTNAAFTPCQRVNANTPFLLLSTPGAPVTASDVTLKAVPDVIKSGLHEGVYRSETVEDAMTFDGATRRFVPSVDGRINPFGTFLYTGDDTTRDVTLNTSTLMDIIGCDPNTRVSVYTIDGRPVRLNVEASEATRNLPAGLYIVGNAKLYIK